MEERPAPCPVTLFPGYAFVRIALRDRLELLKVPGVVRLVGFNGTPVPLTTEEIQTLQRSLAQGTRAKLHPYLTVGWRVRITPTYSPATKQF